MKLRIKRDSKIAREKQLIPYEENPIWLSVGSAAETLQARRECCNLFKVLKGKKKYQLRILYLPRLSFRQEEKTKSLPAKAKAKRDHRH